jgi:hypothetical protein
VKAVPAAAAPKSKKKSVAKPEPEPETDGEALSEPVVHPEPLWETLPLPLGDPALATDHHAAPRARGPQRQPLQQQRVAQRPGQAKPSCSSARQVPPTASQAT